MKVPMSSAVAEPIRLLESTWLPYSPLDCSPSPSFCWPRYGLRVAEPDDEPPDRDPRSKRTSSYRSACDGLSALYLSLASIRRTRGRSSSLGSPPDPDIPRLLSFSCLSSPSGKTTSGRILNYSLSTKENQKGRGMEAPALLFRVARES